MPDKATFIFSFTPFLHSCVLLPDWQSLFVFTNLLEEKKKKCSISLIIRKQNLAMHIRRQNRKKKKKSLKNENKYVS